MKQKVLRIAFIFTAVLLINFSSNSGQTHPNSIYLEALGNGILYSVNYDRLFTENVGGRIGIMYLSSFDIIFTSEENVLLVPIMVNYFTGNKHKLELGAGIVYAHADNIGIFGIGSGEGGSGIASTATIGYRYQNPNGGFLFRVGFTPFLGKDGFEASGGISLGYSF